MWPFTEYLPHADPQCVGRYSYIAPDPTLGGRIVDCPREPFSWASIIPYIFIGLFAIFVLPLLWNPSITTLGALASTPQPDEEEPMLRHAPPTGHLSWLDVEMILAVKHDEDGRAYYVSWKDVKSGSRLTKEHANSFKQGRREARAFHELLDAYKQRDLERAFGTKTSLRTSSGSMP